MHVQQVERSRLYAKEERSFSGIYIYAVKFLKVLESVSNSIFYIVVLSNIIVTSVRHWPIMPVDSEKLQKFYDEFVAQS